MTVRDELLALVDPSDEMIHAESVVHFAQTHPGSELHQEFEWDDASAAYQHRLSQARRLIQIHVVFQSSGKRETVNLVVDRSKGGGYRHVTPVLNNQTLRLMMIRQILDELLRVIDRYPQLTEIMGIHSNIETYRRSLEMGEAAD